jgi:hypothetical protein
MTFMRKMLTLGTAAMLVALGGAALAPGAAYADDPTGVLLSEQRANQPLTPEERSRLPAFSDVGPCQPGMQSESFPTGMGYRCIRSP